MTERIELDPSDGPWLHTLVKRVHAARNNGNGEEAARLLAYGRAEGGEALARLADQLLAALAERDTASLNGEAMAPYGVSAAPDDSLVCDFCAASGPNVYYEVNEFGISGLGGSFLSGDRFYACPRCRELVDASDWKGLRDWIGPSSQAMGHRMLIVGFKKHRKGAPVEFEPGTNPEANRRP